MNPHPPIARLNLRPIFQRVKADFPLRGQLRHGGHEVAWGLRIARRDEGEGLSRVRFSAWALSPDKLLPASGIGFHDANGCIHLSLPHNRRGDVMRALGIAAPVESPVARCGFTDEFDTRAARLEVRITLDGAEITIGIIELPMPEVTAGQDGWLFLAGDSNDSLAQHRGDFRPDLGWQAAWDGYFAALARSAIARVVFLVAPAKESVMPDRHPVPQRARGPIDYLMDRFPSRILYPVEALRTARDLAYDRVDTHWTDLGARIAAERLLTNVGEALPPVPHLYTIAEGHGDLGDKLVPPETALRPAAAWPDCARCVFDNFALHHGRIRILANSQAPLDRRVVIFGGSSADHLVRYLGAACRRVVNIHSAGAWDPAIIAHEQPDIVILQTNERFLVVPPEPQVDCIARAREKIAGGHVTTAPETAAAAMMSFAKSGEDWYASRHAR